MSVSFDRAAPDRGQEAEAPNERTRQDAGRAEERVGRAFEEPDNGSAFPESQSTLIRIIEGEIIPRLFLAHRHHAPRKTRARVRQNHALKPELDTLALHFIRGERAQIRHRLLAISTSGIQRDRICVDVLAPISRILAEYWEEGHCTFEEMARGLACVEQILQEIDKNELFLPEANNKATPHLP
jgi:hypothetical protein